MIVKIIDSKNETDLTRIEIKARKVWGNPCVISLMTSGDALTHSLDGVLRNVLYSAIDADKIVIADFTVAETAVHASFNRLVRIETDICRYLNKEIYHESDLDKMIEEKEKENAQNDTETAPNGCMYQSICISRFLQQAAKDPNARISFEKGGMRFGEHAQNEAKPIEKIRCIAEKCEFFGYCFVYGNGESSPEFEGIAKEPHIFCKRKGGPIPINFGGTYSGDGVRLDGTCCCHGASGSGKSVTGGNETRCGCDLESDGQS